MILAQNANRRRKERGEGPTVIDIKTLQAPAPPISQILLIFSSTRHAERFTSE